MIWTHHWTRGITVKCANLFLKIGTITCLHKRFSSRLCWCFQTSKSYDLWAWPCSLLQISVTSQPIGERSVPKDFVRQLPSLLEEDLSKCFLLSRLEALRAASRKDNFLDCRSCNDNFRDCCPFLSAAKHPPIQGKRVGWWMEIVKTE